MNMDMNSGNNDTYSNHIKISNSLLRNDSTTTTTTCTTKEQVVYSTNSLLSDAYNNVVCYTRSHANDDVDDDDHYE
jgi:hypothetical protein